MSQLFFNNKNFQINKGVYQPREDSFLLANTIPDKDIKAKSCLDMCTGSGIQAINLASKGAASVLAVDINQKAIENAKKNSENNNFNSIISFCESDLFQNIIGKFDLILCNPPYVLSDSLEDIATDAGPKGRLVLDKFLREFPKFLTENAVCYFLQNNLNGLAETEQLLSKHKLQFSIVARKKLFFEELVVYRASN